MGMPTMLPLIVVLTITGRIVEVMMAILLIVAVAGMVMVAVMNVTFLVVPVGVHEKTRVDAARRRKGHAQRGRDGKRQHHRPNDGDAASACSFQSRQHALRPDLPGPTIEAWPF
jgi:hypothetical protein